MTATSTDTLVRCAGNWTSNGSFALTAGTVELDGAGTTQLTGAGPGLDPVFDEVIVRGGTRVVGSDLSVTSNRWTIEPGAGVSIAGFDAALPGATTLVQGELTLLAGARLALDAGSLLNVASTGTLRMLGTVADEAAIIGAAGGGYLLSIDGFLSATNFRFEGMGATGVTLTRLATLDVAPNDLRSGVFARPSSAAGSALLDIRRALPATFTNVDFEDPLGVGTFNVRTTAGAAIVFRNSGGNLAGEDFDDDPFEFVTWETDADVTLASFFATPASEEISVDWSTSAESAVDAFVLRRSLGTGGPYALVGEVPAAGPSAYQIVDTGLVNGQLYEYQLSVRPLAGPEQVLGLVTETPSGPDLPPNVATVGPMGLFPDIQSAINAATGPRPVISVAPGTYASFSVTPGIGGVLRIAADGTGPVVIDTNLAPVQLLNLGATESVELSDLTIGDGSGTNAGIVIQNVIATVVLDELVVQGGAGAAGVLVDASGQVAVQRSALTGSPGLDVSNGSLVFASKGSTSAFSVRGFSTATTCELTGTPTVEPGSTLNALAGVMPDVDLPEFAALGGSFTVTVSGDLGNLWFLLYSFDLSWLPLPAPGFEMVGLGGLSVTILQSGFFGGSASAALPLGLPAAPSFAGLPIVLQSVGVNPVSTVVRFSNVASIVGLNP